MRVEIVVAVTTSSPSEHRRARYDSRDLGDAIGCALALISLAIVLSCIQEQPKGALAAPPTKSRTGVLTAAGSVQSHTSPSSHPVASPVPRQPLAQFKASLSKLANKEATSPVRVLWLGDSHTAGVSWPATFESTLTKSVGSGGPGYVPLGLSQGRLHGARVASDDGFDVSPHPPAKRAVEDDGVFGLGGTRANSRGKQLGVTVRLEPNLSVGTVTVQLLYRYKIPTDRVEIVSEGRRVDVGANGAASFPNDVRAQTFRVNSQTLFEVRVVSGSPELFGLVVENDQPGLVIDVLGINGARFATPLAWEEQTWTSLVRWRQPVLAILAYGTNEVFDLVAPSRYESEIAKLLARIRRAVPDVECILAGPTDVGRGGQIAEDRVREIDTVEAQAAEHLGCAYFSPYQTMGGMPGFDEWLHSKPPLALSDKIHLSTAGYKRLGQTMADSLLR